MDLLKDFCKYLGKITTIEEIYIYLLVSTTIVFLIFLGLRKLGKLIINKKFTDRKGYYITQAFLIGNVNFFNIKEELYDDFRNTVGKRIENKIKTKYVFQSLDDLPQGFECPKDRIKPWGTAHALYSARNCITDNFVIINADDYYGKDAYNVAFKFLDSASSSL